MYKRQVNGKVFFDSEQKINLTPQQRKTDVYKRQILIRVYGLESFDIPLRGEPVGADLGQSSPPPYPP